MRAKYANTQSQFLETADGPAIHYRDEGNPDGEILVLVHGNNGSLHNWEPLVEELGDEYRLISLTLPGHGLTGPSPDHDYSYAAFAKAIDRLTDALALDRFTIVGNSMGGWISWRYTLDNPEAIAALILIDASGAPLPPNEPEPEYPLAYRLAKHAPVRFLMKHFTPRSIVAQSAYDYVAVDEIMDDAMVDRYWELLRYPGNRAAAVARLTTDREQRYADRLPEITAPTLIIWGEEDAPTPVAMAHVFDERIPRSDLVIYQGIGHLPMEEAPTRTALDIDAFLERTIKRQSGEFEN